MDLQNIEPFTMVIVDWNNNKLQLFELIWDGKQKHFNKLKNEPKIWSSSTLYSTNNQQLRKEWFEDWKQQSNFSEKAILEFHHSEIGNKEQSILMKRPNVETVSITLIEKRDKHLKMKYEDVVHSTFIETEF